MSNIKTLGSCAALASSFLQVAHGSINVVDQATIDFFVDNADSNGLVNGQQVMSPRTFKYIDGMLAFDIEFNDLQGVGDLEAVNANLFNRLNNIFAAVDFGAAGEEDLADAVAANFQTAADNAAILDAQDADAKLVSAVVTADNTLAHGPGVFCVNDIQCRGARIDDRFGETILRQCNGLNADGVAEDANVPPTCDTFVAFFTLRWLLAVVILMYVIFIGWAIYMYAIPACSGKKKSAPRAVKEKKMNFSADQQVIINTLAAQCASAENMLFQATDILTQAKGQNEVAAVEVRRERKIFILVAEYFQTVSSMLVSLCHQYLDSCTTGTVRISQEDAAVRALQIEVLNYVRGRIRRALEADAFSEASLLRLAEALAIMKKMTEHLTLVGFTTDTEDGSKLGNIRTSLVQFGENALFLGGNYKAVDGAALAQEGKPVCVVMSNSDKRGATAIEPSKYISSTSKSASMYDPFLESVTRQSGQAYSFNVTAGGKDPVQGFVRSFWGDEILKMQNEASKWLNNDQTLDDWLREERAVREGKAQPVLKKGKKLKKKNKKNKKNKKKYKDADETGSVVSADSGLSGESGASGESFWSVASTNNYVFNIKAITNQGLGIAGKPGLPYSDLANEKRETSRAFKIFQYYFPNASEWPKFYTLVFVVVPILIAIPMLAKVRQPSFAIDIDGNVDFKARPAGFGISYLGCPAYYFLDGEVPELDDLVGFDDNNDPNVAQTAAEIQIITDVLLLQAGDAGPFGDGLLFMSNAFTEELFDAFVGEFGRLPDAFTAEIQSGVLAQTDVAGLDAIRSQQLAQEVGTVWIYALMHNAGYFFSIVPLSLIRESLEILARSFPFIRDIYPLTQWKELHMNMGLAGLFFVTTGATVLLLMMLVSLGKGTPFAGLTGDPNIPFFFDNEANVLWLRCLLLPFVPTLLLMKYATRGPPKWLRRYGPDLIVTNYWEVCYFLHYVTALAAIIILVMYRPQVFYWMGALWGFVWGGNKIVRIVRTRKATIKKATLVSYTVNDERNNVKRRVDVLRLQLNVPASFPSSSRGQACTITVPEVDLIGHPFTLAKVPKEGESTIMFHIGIKYLDNDDIIQGAKPDTAPTGKGPENAGALPPGWKSAVDPQSGQTYYYNSAEQKTSWERPVANVVDTAFENFRALTTRFSTANGGAVGLETAAGLRGGGENVKRPTWTRRLLQVAQKINSMDENLRKNAIKDYPIYVAAPIGTSMDEAISPRLPGSVIITTQNGLPAAESTVRWLLLQKEDQRPKFHFFVSVSREVNDALSICESIRNSVCESVSKGNINVDGTSAKHAHMLDWLGVYINLSRRTPAQIVGDRDILMRSLDQPPVEISDKQRRLVEEWVKNRVRPGRLQFDRFLQRFSQMVQKRTGSNRVQVGYCGSGAVAYSIRAAVREIPNMHFDGEYI